MKTFKQFLEEISVHESSLNDIVWAKNIIKPGSNRTVSKKLNPGDKVSYGGGISTVEKHHNNDMITLSNPNWTKNRTVPHYSVKKAK
jgi:hypothetical protein